MAVELRYEGSDDPPAFLVKFTNGQLNCENVEEVPDVTLLKAEDDSNATSANPRRMLLAETSQMVYLGKNFGPDRHPDNFCKYLVGLMDRVTGEMTLHDALTITMHPRPHMVSSESEGESNAVGDMSYREQYSKLIESFGSGRKKKLVEARQKSQLDDSSLDASIVVAKDYAHTELDNEDSSSLNEQWMSNQARMIPPFDANAETPMDVFKLEDLITPEEYNAIKGLAQSFVEAKQSDVDQWRTEKKYPEYVLRHVEQLWAVVASKVVKRRARCLTYLSFLMAIYNTPHREFTQHGLQQFNLPSVVENRIKSLFTESPARVDRKSRCVIPSRLRDKLLCYILVLSLYIDNFSFDCAILARDLGIQPQKMGEYWRTIGCHMKTQKQKASSSSGDSDQMRILNVELKVPFKLPSPRKRSAQRTR